MAFYTCSKCGEQKDTRYTLKYVYNQRTFDERIVCEICHNKKLNEIRANADSILPLVNLGILGYAKKFFDKIRGK